MIRKLRIDQRQRDRMECEIPGCIPCLEASREMCRYTIARLVLAALVSTSLSFALGALEHDAADTEDTPSPPIVRRRFCIPSCGGDSAVRHAPEVSLQSLSLELR